MRVPCTHCNSLCHQGNQEGILWLLAVDICDSQQLAGGDCEAGILQMHIPRAHHTLPRRQVN